MDLGIIHHVHALLAETDLLMAVNGYPSIADLKRRAFAQRDERQLSKARPL